MASTCDNLNRVAKETATRLRMWSRTMVARGAGPSLVRSMETEAALLEEALNEHQGKAAEPRPPLVLEVQKP